MTMTNNNRPVVITAQEFLDDEYDVKVKRGECAVYDLSDYTKRYPIEKIEWRRPIRVGYFRVRFLDGAFSLTDHDDDFYISSSKFVVDWLTPI